MPDDTTTRWTVSVSRDTDIAVRSLLARRGMKKGDLSRFIEEAVRWRVFEQTVADVRRRFADLPPEELPAITVSTDPHDGYLLAMVGDAEFLVSGDKRDLLHLGHHRGTRIVTVRDFLM